MKRMSYFVLGRWNGVRRAISLFGFAAVTLILALPFAPRANAGLLIVNGGFETGDFTGWTQTGNDAFDGVACLPAIPVYQGNCAAFFGPFGSNGGISQVIGGLTPGRQYDLSFAFLSDGGTPSDFSATFGAATLLSLTNPPATAGYQVYSFEVTPAAASETLAFNFRDDPGFLYLDSASIPEPASTALIAVGLAALFMVGMRRQA
jgi:hypothetical protein